MHTQRGLLYVAVAYVLWGILPLYFKALALVPSFQIVAHRVIWSLVFLVIVLGLRQESGDFWSSVSSCLQKRQMLIYLVSGALLFICWLVYVWAINAGFIIEASLGYFINPLVSVLLGVVVLHEKLRSTQWFPVGLALAGVLYLAVTYGSLPWIALVLAFSFGIYGLLRKVAPLGSLYGLTLETGLLFLPAVVFLLAEEVRQVGSFGHLSAGHTLLLMLVGVATAIPLLLFAAGARSVPLSSLGLLQFISPSLQFLIGVCVYHEPFTPVRLVGFSLIWAALIVFYIEDYWHRHWLQTERQGS